MAEELGELETSIKNIFDIESIKFKELNKEELNAIGIGWNSVRYFYREEKTDAVTALDEGNRTLVLKLFHNPSILAEDYLYLNSGNESEYKKIKLATREPIVLSKRIGSKPPRNFWWRLKNWWGTYELDHENCKYGIDIQHKDQEIDISQDLEVIPIYRNNPDYHRILEHIKEGKIK